jgi:hypothetical protein
MLQLSSGLRRGCKGIFARMRMFIQAITILECLGLMTVAAALKPARNKG